MYANVTVVAAILPITVRPNIILKSELCEHLGISHLTDKKVKIDKNKLKAIQEHILFCNFSPSIEDFYILTTESNEFKLKIMKSLFIERDQPMLNKADTEYLGIPTDAEYL